MEKDEQLWIASWCWYKGYDYEQLYYCDYMNGQEEFTNDVWEYVDELNEIGRIAFYEKYKEFKLY